MFLDVTKPDTLSPAAQLAVAAAIFLTSIGQWIAAHLKGRKADRATGDALTGIAKDVTAMRDDVRDLKALVVGVDGTNGIRSEVRDHEDRIRTIERGTVVTPQEFSALRPPEPRRA